jgi:hypothetical protein
MPLQQSVPAVQWFPVARQHVSAAPHVPVQQSSATLHGPPSAEQAHFDVAVLHLEPGQQSAAAPQVPPAATQPHCFSELQNGVGSVVPVQQSPLRVHPEPSAPHPHFPVATSHTWLQHCESSVHAVASA